MVDIDRRDRQRELMIVEAHGDEDPSGEFSFYVYREGRLWPMLRRVSTAARPPSRGTRRFASNTNPARATATSAAPRANAGSRSRSRRRRWKVTGGPR